MKKIFLFTILCFTFVLSGCVSSTTTSKQSSTTTSVSKTTSLVSSTQKNDKAKVIFLLGQSNMEGFSHVDCAEDVLDTTEYERYEVIDSRVKIAFENVDRNFTSKGKFVNVTFGQGLDTTTFGPEVGVGKYLAENDKTHDFYLIKYAKGGTNLYSDWASTSNEKVGFMYQGFKKFATDCLNLLKEEKVDYEVVAVVYSQGEQDAMELSKAIEYEDNLTTLITDIREDFAPHISVNGLEFIDSTISDHYQYNDYVNDCKEAVTLFLPKVTLIDCSDLEYWNEPKANPDYYHYDSQYMLIYGERFAKRILEII